MTMHEQTVRDVFEMACPNCGSDGDITVVITTFATLSAEGTEPVGDHDWDGDSPCRCNACEFSGLASEFDVNKESN